MHTCKCLVLGFFFLSIICYVYMYLWFYIDRLLSVLFKPNVKTNTLEPVQRYRLSVRHELILSKGTLWFPQHNCFQTVNFTGNIILRYRGNSRQTSWREVRRVIDLYPPSSVCPPPPPELQHVSPQPPDGFPTWSGWNPKLSRDRGDCLSIFSSV